MSLLILNEEDLKFASKARFSNEICSYVGISRQTFKSWLIDMPITQKKTNRLFTPQQVKIILENIK